MSRRYAPLNTSELDAAFDGDDDNSDDDNRPLIAHQQRTPSVGGYDFENVDYDYPPPGSPPPLTSTALPNEFGNSNGHIPSFDSTQRPVPTRRWWQRLPWSSSYQPTTVGGGTRNDGVFANVTAKPSAPMTVRNEDGTETYILPEETRPEAPPSYASAQADSVPPYWETTIHAPFSPDNLALGEMIIDALPTGSLFSFLWNMLVSISFQFVGFLLTYLLHTTHAARLGSRAGLGVTLIQYGFALRAKSAAAEGSYGWEDDDDNAAGWGTETFNFTAAVDAANNKLHHHGFNTTSAYAASIVAEQEASILVADATTEWLSFFLMTVGWFILLTSLLGFWRVKRWERGIIATQQQNGGASRPATSGMGRSTRFEAMFGIQNMPRFELIRQGFGFGPRAEPSSPTTPSGHPHPDRNLDHELDEMEEGRHYPREDVELDENDLLIGADPNDPNRAAALRAALENDRRLHDSLRQAGLL